MRKHCFYREDGLYRLSPPGGMESYFLIAIGLSMCLSAALCHSNLVTVFCVRPLALLYKTSSFAVAAISKTTRGRCLKRNINMGRN